MRLDITHEHRHLQPCRYVEADLINAHPIASGTAGLALIALPAALRNERCSSIDHAPSEVFMVVPSNDDATQRVAGLEQRITLLTNRNDLHRGERGDHLTVWMPTTVVKDLIARAF